MTVTLTVTKEELDLIGAALAELPLKLSGALFSKLQQQFAKQQAEAVAADKKADEIEKLAEGFKDAA